MPPLPIFKHLRWSPTTVSWAGFLLFSLIVAAIGLWGSRQIAVLLEEEMVLHGVDHNRAVFRRIQPQMQALIEANPDPHQALVEFPREFAAAETLSMSIFIVDRGNERIIAHTEQAMPPEGLPVAARLAHSNGALERWAEDRQSDGRALAARSLHDTPVLLYRAPITDQGYARDWDLVVETEMADVAGASAMMQQRVRLLLLTTDLLIVLFGFIALRRVGRQYERGLERKLATRTAELEASHAQVLHQTTLATIGQTTSVLAHEMRNPLAAIKLSLSSLDRVDYLSERDHRRVALVLRETDRLDRLLSETLDHVRPIRRSGEPVPIAGIIDPVVELLTPTVEAHGLKIQWLGCVRCPPLRVDADQLRQAVLNLVKNAIEASPAGATIHIDAEPRAGGWRLAVRNRGEPIAPDDRSRIFDAFFTTRPKGTGLGLFLVKRVITEHGGEVSVSSDAEQGTIVTLTVPPT